MDQTRNEERIDQKGRIDQKQNRLETKKASSFKKVKCQDFAKKKNNIARNILKSYEASFTKNNIIR